MKKVIIILLMIGFIVGLFLSILLFDHTEEIVGIDNYNKEYYIKKYAGDLDSNLSIFPDDITNMINPSFFSSFSEGLFDSEGYILLSAKYTEEDFNSEVKRLSDLEMSISNCNGSFYDNHIKFDENSYNYPAYITIDGFGNTYEYALIDKEKLSINYIYLSHPNINNTKYIEYLKKDKNEYLNANTPDKYSMYNHSFDNGSSWTEFNDCN